LDELERALALVKAQGAAARLRVDLGEVRGFAYYTGIRFAGFVPGVGDAVLQGGRYDDLVARYGRAARATGFAVDVEAIAQGERARGPGGGLPRRGVLIAGEGGRPSARGRALGRRGVRAAVDPGARSADELAGYAADIGARALLTLDGTAAKLYAGGPPRPV